MIQEGLRIGILAGGISNERDISLKSGQAVYEAIKDEIKNLKFIDVSQQMFDNAFANIDIDVAFLVLHGRCGEDGRVQGMLKKKGIRYVGSDQEASSIAFDKVRAKEIFLNKDIPTPEYWESSETDFNKAPVLPAVIKPRREGSSIGINIVTSGEDWPQALRESRNVSTDLLCETYICGRELTVGILDQRPLVPIEIVSSDSFYDFKAKYESAVTKYIVPANISSNLASRAKDLACTAFEAIGCRHYARMDFILENGTDHLYLLEVNTLPGMTERSLLPKAAFYEGISFKDLCLQLLNLAIID